jgi:DNA-binding XRE family transcriptional regulator
METKEFYSFRRRFQKTQKEMSHLLGTSLKAIQSLEQGWRKVPGYIERQMLFLNHRSDQKVPPGWNTHRHADGGQPRHC